MKSIGTRISAIMVCIVLLGIIATVGFTTYLANDSIRDESLAKWQSETARQALYMNEWLNGHRAAVNAVASALAFTDDHSEENIRRILATTLRSESVYEDVYIGFPDDTAIFGSGFPIETIYYRWRATERGWYRLAMTDRNSALITEPYVDSNTGELCITAVRAVVRDGQIIGVAAIDILLPFLKEQTLASTLHREGVSMLIGPDGNIFIHPDRALSPTEDGDFSNLGTIQGGAFADVFRQMAGSDGVYRHRGPDGRFSYFASGKLDSVGWKMVTVLPERVVGEVMMQSFTETMLWMIPIAGGVLLIAALVILFAVKRTVTKPIRELTKAAETISTGDIEIEGLNSGTDETHNEIILLERAFSKMLESFKQQAYILTRVAEGDYTMKMTVRSDKDVINMAINLMVEETLGVLYQVAVAGVQVADGSKQIAGGAQALAQGSAEQADAVNSLSFNVADSAQNEGKR